MLVVFALVIVCLTLWIHFRSFSRSEDVTLFDVSLFTDEGVLTLKFPLTRLTKEGECHSQVRVFIRDKQNWKSGPSNRSTHKNFLQTLNSNASPFGPVKTSNVPNQKQRRNHFDLAGFGYLYGDWLSEERPGPWLKLFVPIWFTGLCFLIVVLTFGRRLLKYKLSAVIGLMTAAALFVWATHLRIP